MDDGFVLGEDLLLKNLHSLRKKDGLYIASTGKLYQHCWIRDIYYQVAPELNVNNDNYFQTYSSLFDYFHKIEYEYGKLSWLIKQPFPLDAIRTIHPRFNLEKKEITSDWGNVQLDALGYFLFGVAQGLDSNINLIKNIEDIEILKKIILILEKVEYWKTPDNGIWEENLEVHSSSVGAVVAGLKKISKYINVNESIIKLGEETLNNLLPRESLEKDCDLSLLTLIWPFNIVDNDMKKAILNNVENNLKRDMGFIRYKGDRYYNIGWFDLEFNGNEAEWTLGPLFLSIIHALDGNIVFARDILNSVLINCKDGKIPELYYSKTKRSNINIDLGWPIALSIIAMRHIKK